jgi:hypothetical protein
MAPLVDIPRKALRGFRFGHTVLVLKEAQKMR